MKTITTELKNHLAGEVTTICTCWRLVRKDGVVKGFTDHVEDITFESVLYEASAGFSPSNIESTENLAVDNMEVIGILSSEGITNQDIIAGLYDESEVYVFMINYNDLTMGSLKLSSGSIGEVTIHKDSFVSEFRGLSQQLQQSIGEVFSVTCRADLFDTRCKIVGPKDVWEASATYIIGDEVEPVEQGNGFYYECVLGGTTGATEPTWLTTADAEQTDGTVDWKCVAGKIDGGTITSLTDREKFKDSSRTEANDYYNFGLFTFTTGNNAGLSMEIKGFTATEFVTSLPFPFDIEVGDKYKAYAGCDKTRDTCRDTFSNVINFRGEPDIPGIDAISKIGGQ